MTVREFKNKLMILFHTRQHDPPFPPVPDDVADGVAYMRGYKDGLIWATTQLQEPS